MGLAAVLLAVVGALLPHAGTSDARLDADSAPAGASHLLAGLREIDGAADGGRERTPMDLKKYCALKHRFSQPGFDLETPQFFRSCAIVSSSSDLLLRKYGKEIDSFHTVMRVNAPLVGGKYEEFVGSKADVYFFNTQHSLHAVKLFPREKGLLGLLGQTNSSSGTKGTTLIVPMFSSSAVWSDFISRFDKRVLQFAFFKPAYSWNVATDLTRFLMNAYTPENAEQWTTCPTSGALALVAALGLCKEVVAYSFQPPDSRATNYSYYEKHPWAEGPDKNEDHEQLQYEHKLWLDIATDARDDALRSGKLHIPGFSQDTPCSSYSVAELNKLFDGTWVYHDHHAK